MQIRIRIARTIGSISKDAQKYPFAPSKTNYETRTGGEREETEK